MAECIILAAAQSAQRPRQGNAAAGWASLNCFVRLITLATRVYSQNREAAILEYLGAIQLLLLGQL
jgi:hypothetical protein